MPRATSSPPSADRSTVGAALRDRSPPRLARSSSSADAAPFGGGGVPTINLRIDYLRPAVGSVLTGTARVRRAGRTVALVDVDVYDEQRALVAVGRGTYSG